MWSQPLLRLAACAVVMAGSSGAAYVRQDMVGLRDDDATFVVDSGPVYHSTTSTVAAPPSHPSFVSGPATQASAMNNSPDGYANGYHQPPSTSKSPSSGFASSGVAAYSAAYMAHPSYHPPQPHSHPHHQQAPPASTPSSAGSGLGWNSPSPAALHGSTAPSTAQRISGGGSHVAGGFSQPFAAGAAGAPGGGGMMTSAAAAKGALPLPPPLGASYVVGSVVGTVPALSSVLASQTAAAGTMTTPTPNNNGGGSNAGPAAGGPLPLPAHPNHNTLVGNNASNGGNWPESEIFYVGQVARSIAPHAVNAIISYKLFCHGIHLNGWRQLPANKATAGVISYVTAIHELMAAPPRRRQELADDLHLSVIIDDSYVEQPWILLVTDRNVVDPRKGVTLGQALIKAVEQRRMNHGRHRHPHISVLSVEALRYRRHDMRPQVTTDTSAASKSCWYLDPVVVEVLAVKEFLEKGMYICPLKEFVQQVEWSGLMDMSCPTAKSVSTTAAANLVPAADRESPPTN